MKNIVAQEYRSPKRKSQQQNTETPKQNSNELSGYKSPGKQQSIETRPSTQPTINKSFGNLEVKKMQSLIKNLSDSFSNRPEFLNSFLSSFSNTKTNLSEALSKLNTASGGFNVDGKWGKMSQQALVNILELGVALLNINEELKLNSKYFTLNDFNELKQNLLGYKTLPNNLVNLPYADQTARASLIQKKIISLIGFYNDIVEKISQNKNLSLVNKVVDTGKKVKNKLELTQSDNVLLQQAKDFYIKIISFNGEVKVPLIALKDKNSYLTWAQANLKLAPEDAQLFFNKYIKSQVNSAEITA